MNWIETANVSVDPLEVEGVVINPSVKRGIAEENGIIRSVEIKVYQVGLVTRSGRVYHVASYTEREEAEKLKAELTREIQHAKEQFFNDTWERLIAVLGEINVNTPAEV